MVSYQVYTSIAFDVAEEKGVQFDGIEDGGSFVQQLAAFWNENKQELKQMRRSEVRDLMEQRVTQ